MKIMLLLLMLVQIHTYGQAKINSKQTKQILTSKQWMVASVWERNKDKNNGTIHDYEEQPKRHLFEIGMPDSLTFQKDGTFKGKIVDRIDDDIPRFSDVTGTWKLSGSKLTLAAKEFSGYVPKEMKIISVDAKSFEVIGFKVYDGGQSDFKIKLTN